LFGNLAKEARFEQAQLTGALADSLIFTIEIQPGLLGA